MTMTDSTDLHNNAELPSHTWNGQEEVDSVSSVCVGVWVYAKKTYFPTIMLIRFFHM